MNEIVVKPKLSEISCSLYKQLEECNVIYLAWKPDLTDFRISRQVTLMIYTKNNTVQIPVIREQLVSYAGILGASLFSASKIIICWDIKQLFSYFRYHLPRHFRFPATCRFIDLRLLESYIDIPGNSPTSYAEATERARKLMSNDMLLKINTEIYTPLSCEVIPSIETIGIINQETKHIDYSHYVIEGSINGRLTSNEAFEGCFLPQNSSMEKKRHYVAGHERNFILFDYRACEVSVLQWLSEDPKLGAIIDSGKGVYETIYKLINNTKTCSDAGRATIKKILLPIFYGMGNEKLSEIGNISFNGAKYLREKLIELFPVAFEWIKAWEEKIKEDPIITDYFGRKLNFTDGNRSANSIRNAIIQSPAALVCLEKLIKLYQQRYVSMEVVATIHDSFVCTVDRQLVQAVASHAKQILESPSEFAPKLKLDVKINYGDNWGELKELQLE